MKRIIVFVALPLFLFACVGFQNNNKQAAKVGENEFPSEEKIIKTDAEWKSILSKEVYYVTREAGTERAFTGKYWNEKSDGIYNCSNCELPLFSSATKFKSGTGWPSFYDVVKPINVAEVADNSHGWKRVEVLCGRCDAHLGHVFEDGPKPTGLRYCINSAALDFIKN